MTALHKSLCDNSDALHRGRDHCVMQTIFDPRVLNTKKHKQDFTWGERGKQVWKVVSDVLNPLGRERTDNPPGVILTFGKFSERNNNFVTLEID